MHEFFIVRLGRLKLCCYKAEWAYDMPYVSLKNFFSGLFFKAMKIDMP